MMTIQTRRAPFIIALRLLAVFVLFQANTLAFLGARAEAAPTASSAQDKWQNVALTNQTVRSIAAAPSNPQEVYAAVDGPGIRGVYGSGDGGRSWSSRGLGNQRVFAVAVCPSGAVYAGTWGGGVFRLVGATWQDVNSGLESSFILTLACDEGGVLYAGTDSRLFKSVDPVSTWTRSDAGLPDGFVFVVGWRQGALFAGTQDGLFRSGDQGLSWSQSGFAGMRVYDLDFDPVNPQRMWAATGGQGIQLSTNGGATWQNLGGPTDTLAVAHDAIGELFAGTLSTGAHRHDGTQWQSQQLDATVIYQIQRAGSGAGHLLAATSNGIWIPLPDVRLTLRSSAPNGATVGAEITYFIDYQTTGNGTISGVVISNPVPEGTEVVPNSIQPAGIGSLAGGVVRWNLADLGPDPEAGTVSYRVWVKSPQVSAGAPMTAQPWIESPPEPAITIPTSGRGAAVTTIVEPGPAAAPDESVLALVKQGSWVDNDADGYADVGEAIDYTFSVTNNGSEPQNNVTVVDKVGGVTVSGGPTTLDVGETDSTTFTAVYYITQADIDAGHFANTATADSDESDPVDGGDDVLLPQDATLSLVKTGGWVDGPEDDGIPDPGEAINYTFAVKNEGNVTLHNVTVVDKVGGVTVGGGPTTLEVGETDSTTFTAVYYITQADIDAGHFANTATADSDESDPVDGGDDVLLPQDAKLTLTKSALPAVYTTSGQVINYSFTVLNSGNVNLSGPFSVSDDLAIDEACTQPADGVLSPGESTGCTATHTITEADIARGSVGNTATATAANGGNPVNSNADSATVYYAGLALTKSALEATFSSAGEPLHYTLVASNVGEVPLSGVSISDPKVGALSCTPSQPATLAPGATLSCTGVYQTTQADLDYGSFSNTATVSGLSGTTVVSKVGSKTVEATQAPRIDLAKSADEDSFSSPGETLHYTIVATNSGNVTLTSTSISDPMLGALSCTPSQPAILAPGATLSCTGTYQTTQADVNGGSVSNTAGVSALFGSTPVWASAYETVYGLGAPSLALTKEASPATYDSIGDIVNYTYVMTNTGNVTLQPPYRIFDSRATATCPSTPSALDPEESVTCSASYSITQADLDAGSVVNKATGRAMLGELAVNSNQAQATVTAVQNPALNLVKATNGADANQAPGPYVAAGSAVQWTYAVTNIGNVTLNNLSVADDRAVTVSCTTTSLAPGAGTVCTASGTAQGGQYANTGTATASSPLGATASDVDSSHYYGVTTGISIIKTVYIGHDGGTSCPGQSSVSESRGTPITYCFRVTNNGNSPLRQVEVNDPALGIVLTHPGELAPAASTTLHHESSIAGDLSNEASATGTPSDPGGNPVPGATPPTATSQANVYEIAPDLSIAKTHTGTSAKPGDTLAFTLTYENTGSDIATAVQITETVPNHTTFYATGSSGGWSCGNGAGPGTVCAMTVGTVPVQGNGSRVFAVKVDNPVPADAAKIANSAQIGDDGTNGADLTPGNNTAADEVTITATPRLTAQKWLYGKATPGALLVYSIGVANTGDRDASDVILHEVVPANTTFDSGASSAGWSCGQDAPAGTPCNYTLGTVDGAGGEDTVYFAVKVRIPLEVGTPLDNTVLVSAANAESIQASAATQIVAGAPRVVVNAGATVGWQFQSTGYEGQSGPFVYSLTSYLPLVMALSPLP